MRGWVGGQVLFGPAYLGLAYLYDGVGSVCGNSQQLVKLAQYD